MTSSRTRTDPEGLEPILDEEGRGPILCAIQPPPREPERDAGSGAFKETAA
jgi:hypothetical protein